MTDCMHTKPGRVFSLVLMLVPARLSAEESTDLVRDGHPVAVIVVDLQAPGMVRDAAALLQRVIEQSSGAKLAIVQPRSEGTDRTILRLTSEPGDRKLDKDGFVFTFPQANRIEIIGGSAHGTLFGVQDFLERYLGVRWLLPGDLGEHIPKHKTIAIPRTRVKEEPAFFSRQLSGSSFRDKEISTFLLRQRMHGRMRFHHNLLHLYPASKYAKTRPEFYPVLNGKRYQPKGNSDYRWQPNLSAEGIVEEGVKNICEFFEKYPDAESYSL
ncbi:MAG: hypothetical protein QF473_08840, partial [Planctomycetota bacterium]|nr:hypothetical protein [Planctomycetota bacterium]